MLYILLYIHIRKIVKLGASTTTFTVSLHAGMSTTVQDSPERADAQRMFGVIVVLLVFLLPIFLSPETSSDHATVRQ